MSSPAPELPGDAEQHWLEQRIEAIVHRRLGHSGSRAFWMLGDQGVTSLGNMFTMWIVGRHVPQEWQYGAYNILLETMLFLNSLQAALVNYPLTIQGASGPRGKLRRSATAALVFTLSLLPVLGLVMGIGAARAGWHGGQGLSGHSSLLFLALAAAGAMVMWQGQEALRRALISEFRIAACIPGDAVSYLGQAITVFILYKLNLLNLITVFLAVGATSLAAMIIQALQIGLAPICFEDIRALGADWWKLGKWAMLTNLSTFITGISFLWVLEFLHTADLDSLAAINLPIKITNPVITSIGGLIIPAVANAASKHNWEQTRRSAVRYAGLGAMIIFPIFAFVAIEPRLCLHFLYDRFNTPSTAHLLRLWVINCTVQYIATILSSWLAGLKEPRYQFFAQMVHVVSVIVLSLPATAIWGIRGLILGGLCTTIIDTLALLYFLRLADRHLSTTPPPSAPVPIPDPAN
jgi:O-antigen/teichoic acid export membrane protein